MRLQWPKLRSACAPRPGNGICCQLLSRANRIASITVPSVFDLMPVFIVLHTTSGFYCCMKVEHLECVTCSNKRRLLHPVTQKDIFPLLCITCQSQVSCIHRNIDTAFFLRSVTHLFYSEMLSARKEANLDHVFFPHCSSKHPQWEACGVRCQRKMEKNENEGEFRITRRRRRKSFGTTARDQSQC